jgi:hypothetical protein
MDKPDAPDDSRVDPSPPATRLPYEAPSIIWREQYEPVSFGVSCALQPGNPPCIPGPANS